MGGVDREQVEFRGLAADDARRAAEEIGILMRRCGARELGHDRRVAGDERPHLDAFASERGGQRAGDVGEPPGFDQGENLRGDGEDFQLAHFASLSIIGWVIRVTPLSVRRNRSASSLGSSPTTRPSGMRTSLSMTVLISRTLRPMLT